MDKFKEDILKEYLKWVDEVTEECDWKTHFGPEEIINILLNIVEKVDQGVENLK